MQYKTKNRLLKTENAAKSYKQQAGAVVKHLSSFDGVDSVLDYGCGKLRYSDSLAAISSKVTFVDSSIQLNRIQKVRGKTTSVVDYVNTYYPECRCLSLENIDNHNSKYDLITCTNVLSAIPTRGELNALVTTVRRLLKRKGVALFVNQHRSSYFQKYRSGRKHLYGYIYDGPKGSSYYGIMTREVVKRLVERNGLEVTRSWNDDDINFVEAVR